MTTHNMADRLAYSHRQADAPYWPIVYGQAFPDIQEMVDLRKNGWHQAAGRDRAIVLSTGRTIYIDEKVREEDWPDIAVEAWSVYPKNGTKRGEQRPYEKINGCRPGWAAEPKDCDYLAYAFEPSQTCYLFPYFGIRAAWVKNCLEWRTKAQRDKYGYRWVEADNGSYWSISIAVPIEALQEAIDDALTISWRA